MKNRMAPITTQPMAMAQRMFVPSALGTSWGRREKNRPAASATMANRNGTMVVGMVLMRNLPVVSTDGFSLRPAPTAAGGRRSTRGVGQQPSSQAGDAGDDGHQLAVDVQRALG